MSETGHIADKKFTVLEVKQENSLDILPEDKRQIALIRWDHGEYFVGIGYDTKTHSRCWSHYHGTGIKALISASKEFNERTGQ